MRTQVVVFAAALMVSSSTYAEARCSAHAEDSTVYARATEVVRHLPEFRAWLKSHRFPVAFGAPIDKEVVIEGRCYWSVSVYADRPERLELWNVFFVRRAEKVALVQENVSGTPIPLAAWRKQSSKQGVKP